MGWNNLLRCFAHFVILPALIFLCTLQACSKKEPLSPSGNKVVKDNYYHFELQIPKTWKVIQADNQESQIRLQAIGGGSKEALVCSFHSKMIIDFKKLSDQSGNLVKEAGKLQSTKHLPDSIFVPWLVDAQGAVKTFKNRDLFTLLFVEAVGPYGYIGVLRGPDEKELHNVITSFKTTVPVKEAGYALVNYMSVFILAVFLGESGFSLRKRLIKLRILKMTAKEHTSEDLKKKRLRILSMLCLAPFWCLLLYLLGIYFLESTTRSIFLVVGPILPILGYFGIIREPPDDI